MQDDGSVLMRTDRSLAAGVGGRNILTAFSQSRRRGSIEPRYGVAPLSGKRNCDGENVI
jgi:hypothetical protein